MNISSINTVTSMVATEVDTARARPVSQDQRTLIQAVKAVNASGTLGQDNELTFILDRATRQAVVRIVSRKTGEVVDQIPAEYVLHMAEELKRS